MQDINEFVKKDTQSITSDWLPNIELIDGVEIREVKNVAKETGYLVEMFRGDWGFYNNKIDQVFQVALFPGTKSGWHVHQITTDRLFVNYGLVKIVLFDARTDSKTYGKINELRFGTIRPAMVIVPPGVWHAVENLYEGTSLLINIVDYAYNYENPDHFRLPIDTDLIPYKFKL